MVFLAEKNHLKGVTKGMESGHTFNGFLLSLAQPNPAKPGWDCPKFRMLLSISCPIFYSDLITASLKPKPGQDRPNLARSGQARPGQTWSDHTSPDQTIPEHNRTEQTMPEKTRLYQARPLLVKQTVEYRAIQPPAEIGLCLGLGLS